MNPKKAKEKDRRRARKLADEAWDAVNDGNLDLAEKIIRRAVEAQPDNPVLWNDQGAIFGLRHKDAEAAEAFRAAIHLAPTFAEAFANLSSLRVRQGFGREAIALQAQAVRHDPENKTYGERLEAYRALVGDGSALDAARTPTHELATIEPAFDESEFDGIDWALTGERLTREGCALVPGVVDAATCARLRATFDDDDRFAKTVAMDRDDYGYGTYRYFRSPVPDEVDRLRRGVYPRVAEIANQWQELLGKSERFPPAWEEFRALCRAAGQTTPTPILLKYGPGGFNALHRDLRGAVYFPIQMAVVLSPRADSSNAQPDAFEGGNFLFCDVPERKKSKRRELAAGLGDVVLFCTRDRIVKVGGAVGLQPVKHGVTPITAGTRFVLGSPFHEYR